MTVEIIVPKLGMTQKDITVVKWLAADGEAVSEGQTMVVIETAKVSYEVPAPAAGSVFSLKKVKDKVKIGDVLGVVAESDQELEEYRAGQAQAPARAGAGAGEDDFFGSAAPEGQGIRLSFEGEAPVATQAAQPAPMAALPTVEVGDRPVRERIPFIGMRRTIADNMMASLMSGAQLTIVTEVDMTELASFRQELKLDRPEAKVTFVDMLIKLLPEVLKEFPILNSALVGDEIICWGDYHIAFAVALEEGLIVPVVRSVDKKGLFAVSREITKLARLGRSGQLEPEDYQGGTFTLSSGGPVEVEIVTPIINPPQNAILALGKIGPKPAVHEGQLAIRTMTNLCLTHDHRVIDGVPASLFMGRLKEIIQTPESFRKILR